MHQLYSGNGPMKVFWMFSGGASSLRATFDDENNGTLYINVGAYTDREGAQGRQLCDSHGVAHFYLSRKEFYRQHSLDPNHPDSRRKFYESLTERIGTEFSPDLICLSGYMHIVTEPLLGYRTILNVHPADLSVLVGADGSRLDASSLQQADVRNLIESGYSRKLKGDNAVYDAIVTGEEQTRSTVHIATERPDEGPVLVQSKPFSVGGGVKRKLSDNEWIKDYTTALQNVMKEEGDGPAYLKALELISQGRVSMDGGILFLDDDEMSYYGYRLG